MVDSTCDAVVDEAVLEVGKEVEASSDLIVRLDEAREVGLIGLVFVVALVGLYEVRVGSDGKALTVVIARIVVSRQPSSELQAIGLIVERRDTSCEIIVKVLGTKQCDFLDLLLLAILAEDSSAILITEDEFLQAVFLELTPRAVLVGEAVTLGIVCGEIEYQALTQTLGELRLIVVLLIVVRIISVASILRCAAGIHVPSGVVASAVDGFFLGAKSIPSDTCALLPAEGEELEDGVLPEVASLDEVGGALCTAAVDVAIRSRLAKASF